MSGNSDRGSQPGRQYGHGHIQSMPLHRKAHMHANSRKESTDPSYRVIYDSESDIEIVKCFCPGAHCIPQCHQIHTNMIEHVDSLHLQKWVCLIYIYMCVCKSIHCGPPRLRATYTEDPFFFICRIQCSEKKVWLSLRMLKLRIGPASRKLGKIGVINGARNNMIALIH